MPDPTPTSRRAAAARKLAQRRRRVRTIRRRVAGLSLATFLAASGAALAQLASGHPTTLTRARTTSTAQVAQRTTSTTAARTTSTTPTVTTHSHRSAATAPSAVTTSAS